MKKLQLQRYSAGQRSNHWAVVTCFVLAAFGLILTVIVHAYAAIWVKGTVQAMTRGTVSAGWARHHHPLWYREQIQGRSAKAQPK